VLAHAAWKGTFRLLDPIKIVVHGVACSEDINSRIMPIVLQGINQHSKGENWVRWQSS
jgi:hypothetical protein